MSFFVDKVDVTTFKIYKDEPTTVGELGIPQNKIIEIPNFVTPEGAENMINYIESYADLWGDIAFYGLQAWGFTQTTRSLQSTDYLQCTLIR